MIGSTNSQDDGGVADRALASNSSFPRIKPSSDEASGPTAQDACNSTGSEWATTTLRPQRLAW
jgi:hypothetical protein